MFTHCPQAFQSVGMFGDIGCCRHTASTGDTDALVGCFIAEQYFFNRACVYPCLSLFPCLKMDKPNHANQ